MLKPSEAKTWIYGFTACHPPIPPQKKSSPQVCVPRKQEKQDIPNRIYRPSQHEAPQVCIGPSDCSRFWRLLCRRLLTSNFARLLIYDICVSFLHAGVILGRCLWNEFFISHVEDQESQDIQILPFLDDRKSIRSNSCTYRRFFLSQNLQTCDFCRLFLKYILSHLSHPSN